MSSGTDRKTPRRMALSVRSRNHRSTKFSHGLEVGVKWKWKRGCLASRDGTGRVQAGNFWRPRPNLVNRRTIAPDNPPAIVAVPEMQVRRPLGP